MLSISLIVNAIPDFTAPSFVDWATIVEIVGASFTGVNVKVKFCAAVKAPSLTVIVIEALPFALATGERASIQFG